MNLRNILLLWLLPVVCHAQIDPYKRELLQLGYNGHLRGHAPVSAYAFYYDNRPGFLQTNLTLRLAVAPIYLDSELGIAQALGPTTDVGIGAAGGGFADSYSEIRRGKYETHESFYGHGGQVSASVYHLFNPGKLIPLNGVLRGFARFSTYGEMDSTASDFEVPDDRGTFGVRSGLRWGGKEPTLFPDLAMEISAWYEGEYRTGDGLYGYGDRRLEEHTHKFWGQAVLVYTMPELKHSFELGLSAGAQLNPDRFSAYRLGAFLPLISEFPLSVPGYYYQEISSRAFVLISGEYLLPLEPSLRWNLNFSAATAVVDYLSGLDQPGNTHSGFGLGVLYRTSSFKSMIGYAYGVDAMRGGDRGGHSIGVLVQVDWGQARRRVFDPATPTLWRGFQQVLGIFR